MKGRIKDCINLISLQELKGQDLTIVGRVKTGLISQPEFLILEDESGAHHEINPEFFTPDTTMLIGENWHYWNEDLKEWKPETHKFEIS